MRRFAAVVLCACVAASSGCGYALAGRGSFLPVSIRTVGIPKLENRSPFFQVEDILTEKIRSEPREALGCRTTRACAATSALLNTSVATTATPHGNRDINQLLAKTLL